MEKVVDKKIVGNVVQYLIKFRGYDEPEWILEEDIFGDDLVDAYERDHPINGVVLTRRKRQAGRRQRLKRRAAANTSASQVDVEMTEAGDS